MMPAEYSMESLHDANWCCGRFFFVFLIYLESFYPSLQDFKEKVKQMIFSSLTCLYIHYKVY